MHSDTTTYECDICGQVYLSETTARWHVRDRHDHVADHITTDGGSGGGA